jgi:hypothetical protein
MAPSVAAWPDGFRLDTDSSGDDSFAFGQDLSSALFNAPGLNSALIDSFRRDHPALRTAATISALCQSSAVFLGLKMCSLLNLCGD